MVSPYMLCESYLLVFSCCGAGGRVIRSNGVPLLLCHCQKKNNQDVGSGQLETSFDVLNLGLLFLLSFRDIMWLSNPRGHSLLIFLQTRGTEKKKFFSAQNMGSVH